MSAIKRLIEHIVWFNRKSPHYLLGNWFEYVWGDQIEKEDRAKGWRVIFMYIIYYPVALAKFLWFSRREILK